jgi:hypothetical protein
MDLRLDDLERAPGLHALGPAPGGSRSPITAPAVGDRDLHLHDRLEDGGPALGDAVLERERARDLEGHLGAVDIVVLAVVKLHLEVHHRVARQEALQASFLDALLHRRPVVLRNRAAEDLVDELELGATR